jgi:hypothetical protein
LTAVLLVALAALSLESWVGRGSSPAGATAAALVALAAALPAVDHTAWFFAAVCHGVLLPTSGLRLGHDVMKATAAALRGLVLAALVGLLAPNLAFALALPLDLALPGLAMAAAVVAILAAVLDGGPRLAPFAAVGAVALPFGAHPIACAVVAVLWVLAAAALEPRVVFAGTPPVHDPPRVHAQRRTER